MAQSISGKSSMMVAMVICLAVTAFGQDSPLSTPVDSVASDQAATHDAIRSLRDSLINAIHKKDIDSLTSLLHEDVVLTAQDGDQLVAVRKREGVRAYMQKLLTGPESGIVSLTTKPVVDELTILHGGDTGVAFGSSSDHYVLRDGGEFDLDTRWSATLVQVDGTWQVANMHVSSNLFDNPITKAMSKIFLYIGLASGIAGLFVGYLIAKVVRKRVDTARAA